jgi:hypothetical protein
VASAGGHFRLSAAPNLDELCGQAAGVLCWRRRLRTNSRPGLARRAVLEETKAEAFSRRHWMKT